MILNKIYQYFYSRSAADHGQFDSTILSRQATIVATHYWNFNKSDKPTTNTTTSGGNDFKMKVRREYPSNDAIKGSYRMSINKSTHLLPSDGSQNGDMIECKDYAQV